MSKNDKIYIEKKETNTKGEIQYVFENPLNININGNTLGEIINENSKREVHQEEEIKSLKNEIKETKKLLMKFMSAVLGGDTSEKKD